MATAIHHGAPGSYKTFTLVQRHAIDALKAGRAVVTNIRGFNDVQNVKNAYPETPFPDSARIIWVDTTHKQGRHKMACWFHWVPFGALVIIDELQQIYPERRDFKMESLDNYFPEPGEDIEDINHPEGRPEDVFVAFDKQRHYNWDLFGSTTNIAKVKKEIRQVTEWAYRHRNMSGMLPWWKDRWREFQHDPEVSGKSVSHYAGTPKDYQADKRVFNCYSSTATGKHSGVHTSESVLKDPKLRVVGVVILICFWFIGRWLVGFFTDDKPVPAPVAVPVAATTDLAVLPRAHEKPGVRPDSAVETIKLTAQTIRRLSVHGLDDTEIDLMPMQCKVNSHRVACQFLNTPEILQASTNFYCHDKFCTVYFFPKPLPDSDKNGQHRIIMPQMALAKAGIPQR